MARMDEFDWLTEINRASIVTNLRSGLINHSTAVMAADALRGVVSDVESGKSPRAKRVILYEPLLIAKAGPEVTVIHAGRSSQDMHSTFRLAMLRSATLDLMETLDGTLDDLALFARKNESTLLPAYTNGVPAQPTTLAHLLSGYIAGFARDRERLSEFYIRMNECPMGCTVLNGTGWPLDRNGMSDFLGFDRPRRNAFDATQISQVDLPVELAGIVAAIGLHVGEMIGGIMTQYAQPRPWLLLSEGGDNTYVSSAMPQKRNPGLLNNTRAEASDAVAAAEGVFLRAHNVVSGMMDGKSAGKNTGMADTASSALTKLRRVIAGIVVNRDRALEELNLDWTASQEIADQLMLKHGLPFRIGHHMASAMVNWARAHDVRPSDFPYDEMKALYRKEIESEFPDASPDLPMTEAEFHSCLDPKSILEKRQTAGSANPKETSAMLSEQEARIAWYRENTAMARRRVASAHQALADAFDAIR